MQVSPCRILAVAHDSVAVAGDVVNTDEVIAQIETDKITIDVQHTGSKPGVLTELSVAAEDTVTVGQAIGTIDDDADKVAQAGGSGQGADKPKKEEAKAEKSESKPAEPSKPAAPPKKDAPKQEAPKETTPAAAPKARPCSHGYKTDGRTAWSFCSQYCTMMI